MSGYACAKSHKARNSFKKYGGSGQVNITVANFAALKTMM